MSQNNNSSVTLSDGAIIRSIGIEEYPRVLPIMKEAFPDVTTDFFKSITLNDPWYNPKNSLVVEKDDQYLAHVQIFNRTLWVHDEAFHIGGIGSVGTLPSARGRGYASSLMKHAIELMQEEKLQGALLFTGINSFYEKLGWKTLTQREYDVSVHQLTRMSFKDEFRGADQSDYPILQAMYGSLQSKTNGLMIREEDYWKVRSSWLKHLPIIALSDDKIIGYFFATQYKKSEKIFNISEFGLAEDTSEAAEALLAVMGRKATEYGCHTIRAFFKHHPTMNQYLEENDMVENEKEFRYMMWYNFDNELQDVQELCNQHEFLYWQADGI